jgi:hypothetical protein
MRALLASRWFQLDCVFALVLTAIGVGSVFTTDPTVAVDYPPANAPLVFLAIGASLPLAFRGSTHTPHWPSPRYRSRRSWPCRGTRA